MYANSLCRITIVNMVILLILLYHIINSIVCYSYTIKHTRAAGPRLNHNTNHNNTTTNNNIVILIIIVLSNTTTTTNSKSEHKSDTTTTTTTTTINYY